MESSLAQLKNKKTAHKIHTINDFHTILKRERSCSDRNNHGFSLIVFDVGILEKHKILAKNLIDILTSRVRISDDVGWFDERRIGILLPDTSSKDAGLLAKITCKKIAVIEPTPVCNICNIYTYPHQERYVEERDIQSPGFIKRREDIFIQLADRHKMPLWKRVIDIIGSSLGLIALSPLFMLMAIIIKIVSPGPVFFRQKRVGYAGKIFTFWKFRTMKTDNDETLHYRHSLSLINCKFKKKKTMWKLDKHDIRIIPMGKILRKTCIDEIPQLINVLRGEMSLVGPRPCLPYEAREYQRWHIRRFDITPGMTGLWQVSGKNKTTFDEMIRLDIKYAKQRSLRLDIVILLKTPIAILSQMFGNFAKIKNKISFEKNEKAYAFQENSSLSRSTGRL